MNEPIRILQIVSNMEKGGIQTLLMNLHRNIDRTKIQFDYLVHSLEEGFFDREAESLGGKVWHIPRFGVWRIDKQLKAYDEFFKNHPEYKIVHSHIDLCNLGTLRAAYKRGVPTRICHLHCANFKGRNLPFSYRCKKAAFPLVSRYLTHRFACSKLSAVEGYGGICDDVIVLKNGVQTEKFKFNNVDRERKRKELGWDNKFVVISVANFVEPKNHAFLIDVFNETLKRQSDVLLASAGFGPLRTQMERKVKDLGIVDHVNFLGGRNDVPDLLKAADLFLFPSLHEGFPVSLIEAQATGIPIIASTAVTTETDIADLMRFVSLEESPQRWAQILLEEANRKRKPRESYVEVVKNAGFDISASAKELTDFYLSEYRKNLNA